MNISQPQKDEFKDLLQFFKDCVEYTPALHKNLTFYYTWITLLFATHREIEGDLGGQPD